LPKKRASRGKSCLFVRKKHGHRVLAQHASQYSAEGGWDAVSVHTGAGQRANRRRGKRRGVADALGEPKGKHSGGADRSENNTQKNGIDSTGGEKTGKKIRASCKKTDRNRSEKPSKPSAGSPPWGLKGRLGSKKSRTTLSIRGEGKRIWSGERVLAWMARLAVRVTAAIRSVKKKRGWAAA